jgi:hypothetical protein
MRRHNSNSTIAWSDFPQEISGNFNILFDFSKKISMFRKKKSIFGSVIMRICCRPFFGSGRAANLNTFTGPS